MPSQRKCSKLLLLGAWSTDRQGPLPGNWLEKQNLQNQNWYFTKISRSLMADTLVAGQLSVALANGVLWSAVTDGWGHTSQHLQAWGGGLR